MTRILALETAGETCSVALLDDGNVIERFEHAPRRQTELVLPMVEGLLADAGVRLKDLDGIAFGHGPGAFTGVRVAAAVTQGLAFSGGPAGGGDFHPGGLRTQCAGDTGAFPCDCLFRRTYGRGVPGCL